MLRSSAEKRMKLPDYSSLDANQQLMRELFRKQSEAETKRVAEAAEKKLAQCLSRLAEDEQNPKTYIKLASCYDELNRQSEALDILNRGMSNCPPTPALYKTFIRELAKSNITQEAIQLADDAAGRFLDEPIFLLLKYLTLPVLYTTAEEVGSYNDRFRAGLETLITRVDVSTPALSKAWLDAISDFNIFHLAYQALDILPLQRRYSELLRRIMSSNYPQWAGPVQVRPVPLNGKLRIGYVSAHFRWHSVTKNHLGWLRKHDRERFDVYAYSMGPYADETTEEVSRIATKFWQYSGDFEAACETILKDNLHVLVHLDIGMDPIMAQLGALRLAPVQCAAWGHPVTSGLPAVDYFLSSELMEPKDGERHYSEDLTRLPGIGVYYEKPVLPTIVFDKTRLDFGLREDSTVYLSCQSSYKYLPEFDHVFAEIAKSVPNAQIAFLAPIGPVEKDFRDRLNKAFSAAGLRYEEFCVFVPRPDIFRYWNLNAIADVYLDTISWSGFNTTMEAIACEIPVVTMPGRFMRGRHSYAILKQLGVTDTIAYSEKEYISVAARLGLDRIWRERVVERMVANYGRLYSDLRSVTALEDFYSRVVRKKFEAHGH
jgi:protein O-GlcNAc transferase